MYVVNVSVTTSALFIVRRKLVLYPNGDKSRNGDGYISLYLVMADTAGFSPGWEINAIFKFFVFDQLQDKYLTIGGIPFLCMRKSSQVECPFNCFIDVRWEIEAVQCHKE